MTSNSKKITFVIAVVFVIALIFLIGVVFFGKDNKDAEITDNQNNQQEEQNGSNVDPKNVITEEQKTKTFAENFATTYYSYTWGNFSNIESQYYYMTYVMKDREINKIKQIKSATENQPQKYFTARAKVIDSNFIFYEETKATLEINLDIKNYAGSMVERDTIVWVDERGNYYEGNLNNLIISATEKKIKIELLKFDDEWKVDEIISP